MELLLFYPENLNQKEILKVMLFPTNGHGIILMELKWRKVFSLMVKEMESGNYITRMVH